MRLIDADAVIEEIKRQAWCTECDNYNGIRCKACSWDDAMALVDDFADNHPVTGQEAHVLTLDEAFDLQEKTSYPCIFVDIKGRDDVFLAYISDEIYGDYHSDDFKVYRPWMGAERIYHKTEYGRSIRFWTLFPTDEQRNAVMWE